LLNFLGFFNGIDRKKAWLGPGNKAKDLFSLEFGRSSSKALVIIFVCRSACYCFMILVICKSSEIERGCPLPREYLIYYRVPGFLVVVGFPPSLPYANCLSFYSLPVCRRSSLLMGGGGGRGKEPNHTTARKPGLLQSINYSLALPLGFCSNNKPQKRKVAEKDGDIFQC
jgi:hypothetical protein